MRTTRLKLNADAIENTPLQTIVNQALAFNDIEAFTKANFINMYKGDLRKLSNSRTASRHLIRSRKFHKNYLSKINSYKSPMVRTEISEQRQYVENPEADQILANHLLSKKFTKKSNCIKDGQGIRLSNIALNAFEQRDFNIELTVPEEAKSDEFIAFHFLQESDDLPTGGYSILVKVK